MDTLRNNEPEDEFKNEINHKKETVKSLLKETVGEFETKKEILDFNVNKFERSGNKKLGYFDEIQIQVSRGSASV